jgi:hypothetical protein
MYYHVNYTAKTKGSDDLLFFAEAMCEVRDELVVNCIFRVNPFDEGISYSWAKLAYSSNLSFVVT